MEYPQFFIGQKVIYKKMEREPLTLLTITEINGTQITAQLPGGSYVTSDRSSFAKYVPKTDKETDKSKPQKKIFTNKNAKKKPFARNPQK